MLMATVFVCGVAMAQTAPPIKMGLWEKTITTTGMESMPSTITDKSCVTPAGYQRMVANITRQRPNCTTQISKTAKGYNVSGTCTVNGSALTVSGSTTFPDSEHILVESHTTVVKNGQKSQIEMHSNSHWLGANCGNVKPDEDQ
jgi:hypothetical protein